MLGALVLAPVILGFHIADSDQVKPLRDHPSLAVAGAVGAVVVAGGAGAALRPPPGVAAGRRRGDAALPRADRLGRLDGQPARAALPRRRRRSAGLRRAAAGRAGARRGRPRARARWSGRWPRSLALYGIQASYSDDFGHALENVVFFYVPFALLFVLVARVAWTPRLARVCLGRARRPRAGARRASASSSTRRATCSSTRRSSPPTSSRTTSGSTRCSSTPTSTGASWPS